MEPQHVILLRKNLDSTLNDKGEWIPRPYTHWLILGHFDEMYLYSLSQSKDFLGCIYQDKCNIATHSNGSVYYHPLYLVPSTQNLCESDDKCTFIAIVRIHFALTQKLSEQFKKLSDALIKDFEKLPLSYQIFHATEFSDMVLDVRSNNLELLLRTVLTLRQYEYIGKMYTYFGINTAFLENDEDISEHQDIIPMLSMRFSGSDLSVVINQIKIVKNILGLEPEYSVNGVDDVLLHYTNLPTANLLKLYREWFYNKEYLRLRQSESTTRVGIQIDIETQFSIPPKADLSSFCKNLIPLRDSVAKNIAANRKTEICRWFPTISEVANSIVRMSRNPIMDEIVYLLAPGVEAFLVNVQYQLQTNNSKLSDYAPIYYRFVENCAYLMEQLMRIEGQLSQKPEMRPVICDIPVFMLEYTLAFLNNVSELLQKKDANPNLHYIFLLVPRPCERISATELFSAEVDRPGLVQLEIPEKALYSPDQILRPLCHEISHYVGEKYRMRKERKQYYARAAATLLTDCIFCTKSHRVSRMLEDKFQEQLDKLAEPTIELMYKTTFNTASALFRSKEAMNNFFREYFSGSSNPAPIAFPSDDAIVRGLHRFKYRCADLNTLFREVYADICMLYILKVPTDDYIKSILQELEIDPKITEVALDGFAIRVYISLTALKRSVKYDGNCCRDLWSKIYAKINYIDNQICNGKDGKGLHYPISAINSLLEYTIGCYNTISPSLPSPETEGVQNMYDHFFSKDLTYSPILEAITTCRANMLVCAKQKNTV